MALSFTNFVTGDSVSSSEIKSQLDSIEDFVNEDITSSDLTTSNGWLTRALIYKPEFYGSPNPRMLAVTGDIYHRKSPAGHADQANFHAMYNTAANPVPGLAVTFKVPRDNTLVSVYCSFHAYESGGKIDSAALSSSVGGSTDDVTSGTSVPKYEGNDRQAVVFTLRFDDGSDEDGTQRYVQLSSIAEANHIDGPGPTTSTTLSHINRTTMSAAYFARKNLSIIAHKTLNKGVHSVGVYCKPISPTNGQNLGRVAVDVRSMVVDVHSNYQSS